MNTHISSDDGAGPIGAWGAFCLAVVPAAGMVVARAGNDYEAMAMGVVTALAAGGAGCGLLRDAWGRSKGDAIAGAGFITGVATAAYVWLPQFIK